MRSSLNKGSLSDNQCPGTQVSDFPVFKTIRNKGLLFNQYTICRFVVVAQAKWYRLYLPCIGVTKNLCEHERKVQVSISLPIYAQTLLTEDSFAYSVGIAERAVLVLLLPCWYSVRGCTCLCKRPRLLSCLFVCFHCFLYQGSSGYHRPWVVAYYKM